MVASNLPPGCTLTEPGGPMDPYAEACESAWEAAWETVSNMGLYPEEVVTACEMWLKHVSPFIQKERKEAADTAVCEAEMYVEYHNEKLDRYRSRLSRWFERRDLKPCNFIKDIGEDAAVSDMTDSQVETLVEYIEKEEKKEAVERERKKIFDKIKRYLSAKSLMPHDLLEDAQLGLEVEELNDSQIAVIFEIMDEDRSHDMCDGVVPEY